MLGPNANATIDGNQVADAMKGAVDARYRAQHPDAAAALYKVADTYRRPLSLQDAEDYLQSANGELHAYYAKSKVGQNVAQSDPSISHVVAEATSLRSGLYDQLNNLTGEDAAELKKNYGALSNVEEAVMKRNNVAARQQPDSLQQQVNKAAGMADIAESAVNLDLGTAVRGAGRMAMSSYLKDRNSPEWLIKNAFENIGQPAAASTTAPPSSAPWRMVSAPAKAVYRMGKPVRPYAPAVAAA